jgi:hypothetical protein
MTLLEATPPAPPRRVGRYFLIVLAIFIVAAAAYAAWRIYPEEHVVSAFFKTLQQGNYREAYRLWQPSSTYSYKDFLHDWGDQRDDGKIRSFKIVRSRSKGKQSVIVTVMINDQSRLDLVVDRRSKGLAFSPF